MPTISSRTAEASDNANKADNVPDADSASASHYAYWAASAMPQDAAPPPFHPNTAPGKHLPNVHQKDVVVGGKTPPLASQSVEVGGKSTPLKAKPLASVQTSTHTVAATDITPQRCNRTPARAATAVDISPAMVATAVDTPFDFTKDSTSIPPVSPPLATWDCCGMTHLTATRSRCGKFNKWMGGKRKPQISKCNSKAAKGANKMAVKGKVSKKKGVAKYPASQITLSPAGTQMSEISGATIDTWPQDGDSVGASTATAKTDTVTLDKVEAMIHNYITENGNGDDSGAGGEVADT